MSTCSEWFRHVFRKGKLQAPNALQCAALPAFGFASEAAGWVSTQTRCLEKQHVTFDQHIRHWNSWTFRRVPSCFSSGTWSSGRFLFQAVACAVTFLLRVSVRTSREGFLDGVHMHLHVDLDDSNCVLDPDDLRS